MADKACNLRSSALAVAIGVFAAGALYFGATSTGHAALKLRLISGADTVIVSDNDVAGQIVAIPNTPDNDPLAGFISFSGSVGSFSTVISVGISQPNTGIGNTPLIELVNINVSSNSAGIMTVELTDTGFSGGDGRFVTEISNLDTTGSASLKTAVDINDAEFATVKQIGNLAALGPGSGLGSKISGAAPIDANYSISLLATITHGSGIFEYTQLNATVSVPEPHILALFGIGLIGLGLLTRLRARLRVQSAA